MELRTFTSVFVDQSWRAISVGNSIYTGRTEHGRLAITGLLAARQADVKSLLKAA
jgi:hypothetical protein